MSHSFRSPSKSHMWMHCFGSIAQPENQVAGGSSDYADDGTASHTLASWALERGKDASQYPELSITVGGKEYEVDNERADFVQTYIDEVRRRSMNGIVFIEHRVDLGEYLGEGPCWKCLDHSTDPDPKCVVCNGSGEAPQGGTSDTVIILPEEETLIAMDLKYGMGEKVYAGYFPYPNAPKRKINTQCGNYLLGAKKDAELLGHKISKYIAVIDQPRLGHRDEFEITAEELETFADEVRFAVAKGDEALTLGAEDPKLDEYLRPDEKTCRWCNAKARCKALARFTAAAVKLEFDEEGNPSGIEEPATTEHLSAAYAALPLVQQWVKAVNAALWKAVPTGTVIGPDGKPLKLVQGKDGKRMWDPTQADETAVMMEGAVGEDAYQPRTPLTAPAFEKVLKKRLGLKGKKFDAVWERDWVPRITNAKGSMSIALGSDPRPSASQADASEFDDEISTEDES